ncbi:F0F1 ATP synthase subunit A [Candidatus Beckwithbacteria bacterium]|nr:F0F1 ATP synthase subunit A [Candidatus Beckwithbacteria bacterium]
MALNISIAAEPIFKLGNFNITNSVFTTFFVSLFLILIALAFYQTKKEQYPKGRSLQNIIEMLMEMLYGFYTSIVGKKTARLLFPMLTTLFFFIVISNWSGLLPGVGSIGLWEEHHGTTVLVPFFRAPTADLNTTLALALITMTFVQIQGFSAHSLGYLKKFFNFKNPILTFVGLLEIISELVKIISFAFRLFGNIFAGEVLLAVMAFLIPVIASIPFLGLEIFVGVIQALVFVMLTLVFTAGAREAHH